MLLSPISAAFEALGRAVVFLDGDLQIVEASPSGRGIFAMPDLGGQPLLDLLEGENLADAIRRGDASPATCDLVRSPGRFVVVRSGKLSDGLFSPSIRYILEFDLSATAGRADDAGEAQRIRRALEAHRWRRTAAARALGISRATLWRRMRAHGML